MWEKRMTKNGKRWRAGSSELVLAKIKGVTGIHEFLVQLKPRYDRAQMFHPCQKANVCNARSIFPHNRQVTKLGTDEDSRLSIAADMTRNV